MDPSLLKGLQAFKNRSLATPVIESSKKSSSSTSQKPSGSASGSSKPKRKSSLPPQLLQQAKKQAAGGSSFNYKTANLRAKSKFSILSSVVDLMKSRYQRREFAPLSLDEILDLTNNTDINPRYKEWLASEALRSNAKLSFKEGKYAFKPTYELRDKKSLLRLLEKREQNGLGGVLLDEIREGLPRADEIVKAVSDRILFVTRPNDKRAILFNYDSQYAIQVDEEFQKHWRSVAVEGLGEADIERYLTNEGITTMQGMAVSNSKADAKKRKQVSKRKRQFKVLNTHLGNDVMRDYSNEVGKGSL